MRPVRGAGAGAGSGGGGAVTATIVTIEVETPRALSKQQKQLLEQLRDISVDKKGFWK